MSIMHARYAYTICVCIYSFTLLAWHTRTLRREENCCVPVQTPARGKLLPMTGRLLLASLLQRRRRRSRYQPCWHRWRRRLRPTARPTVSVIVMTHRRCHYQLCWYRGRRRLHPGPGRDTSRRDSVHWPPVLCSTAWGTAQCSGGPGMHIEMK